MLKALEPTLVIIKIIFFGIINITLTSLLIYLSLKLIMWIERDKSKDIRLNHKKSFKSFFLLLSIPLLLIITMSFASNKGEASYYAKMINNRFQLANYMKGNNLYHKPGSIYDFFHSDHRTIIYTDTLNYIKNYRCIKSDYDYQNYKNAIVKKAQYRLKDQKKYYRSDV